MRRELEVPIGGGGKMWRGCLRGLLLVGVASESGVEECLLGEVMGRERGEERGERYTHLISEGFVGDEEFPEGVLLGTEEEWRCMSE